MLDLGALALTDPPSVNRRPQEKTPWQWRGRNAIGAPAQSFVAPLLLGGDDALIMTLGGGIGLYNLKSGHAKWSQSLPVGVASTPLVSGNSVIVAGMDGNVRKMRLDSGEILWTSRVSAESLGGVSASQGFVFITTGDDSLWALDEKTGQSRWTYKRPAPQASVYWSLRGTSLPLVSNDGKRIFAGFSDGVFVALEASSGDTVWERNFDRAGRFKDADQLAQLSQDGSLIYVPLVDGDLLALKSTDGSTLWSVPEAGGAAPLIDEKEGVLYASLNSGAVQKISLKDTKVLWSSEIDGGLTASPVSLGDTYLAVTSSHKGLSLLDRTTGKIVYQKDFAPGLSAPPVFDGRRLFVLSGRNRLLMYRIEPRGT